MKNTLTREELLEAKNAFGCYIWVEKIQQILNSSFGNEILIEEKYLDLIKEKATWEQILFCKSLKLDLKMNLPEEAKGWILENIKSCEIVKLNDFRTLYQKNGESIFVLDSEYKDFWFHNIEIEEVLRDKYSLKYNEIRGLMVSILKEYLKVEGYTSFTHFCLTMT